jgi:hypothetical protein
MGSATYDVKCPAGALATHIGDEDSHGFLVGTRSLRALNEASPRPSLLRLARAAPRLADPARLT